MDKLHFSVAGVPHSAKKSGTLAGLERIAELGLDGMELEFVRGVRMKEELALQTKEKAEELGLILTAHAPYFINLNAAEKEKLSKTYGYIIDTAKIASLAGAVSITFHPGYYLKQEPTQVYNTIRDRLAVLLDKMKEENYQVLISPETMGKTSVFGSLEEILGLVKDLNINLCIDFSHLHARSNGEINGYEDFCAILDAVKAVNPSLLKTLHMHASGILYGPKGEKKHLPFAESEFKYKELLQALKDYEVCGVLVCESPLLEEDALLLKEAYLAL